MTLAMMMIDEANLILILTKRFEQVWWGKLPVEENGAVVDVESPAHADEQDLQAAYRVATGRGKDMEMEKERREWTREERAKALRGAQNIARKWKNNDENGESAS